jgi:subtilisin family serine protease
LFNTYHLSPGNAVESAQAHSLTIQDGKVWVTLVMQDEASADAATPQIAALGGEVKNRYQRWMDALAPIGVLDAISQLPGVSLVRWPTQIYQFGVTPDPSGGNSSQAGPNVTQGVVESNADDWHAANLRGQGMKIGVIDQFKDYTTAQALGELPAQLGIFNTLGTASRHGTAVAEIIYDMAPAVSMTLATLPLGDACVTFANTLLGLAQAGHKIVSSSVGSLTCGSGDGNDDPIASAASAVYNTYGTLFFQAAGNHARKHWDGNFLDTDADNWHEFASGDEVNNIGTLQAGFPVDLELRWNSWPTTNQDYDVCLLVQSGATWSIVTCAQNTQDGSQPPTESLYHVVAQTGNYGIGIYKFNATGSQTLDMFNFYFDFERQVQDRSIVGPATSAHVFAVAAIDAGTKLLESYSSHGPTRGPGGALTGGRNQPQLAGFANVDTWAYGPQEFNGTSSATPHVAGAAALIWAASPCFSPGQVTQTLRERAIDGGASGYDFLYGYGKLYLGAPYSNPCQLDKRVYVPMVRR